MTKTFIGEILYFLLHSFSCNKTAAIKTVRKYDFDSGSWSQLNDMQTARSSHGCGWAIKSDGTVQYVVAGGTTNGGTSTFEISESSGGIWR